MTSPELLSHFEHCQRDGFWSFEWERHKLEPNQMLQEGLRIGLTSLRKDYGQAAGERCYELGANPGIESKEYDVHSQVVHLAALADIVSCAVRGAAAAPWSLAQPVRLGEGPIWYPEAFIEPKGDFLRRVVFVTSWNDDRHYHEARSYFSLGEVCVYGLPMQQAVIVLGAHRDGRRHGPLSKGLLHPKSKKVRFRKKNDVSIPFKDSWIPVWREDRDEIGTQDWLEAMLDDGVLQDHCFSVTVDVPEKTHRQKIIDLAAKKLDQVADTKELPDQNLTTCDWPTPCAHRSHCHKEEPPSQRYGFVQLLPR